MRLFSPVWVLLGVAVIVCVSVGSAQETPPPASAPPASGDATADQKPPAARSQPDLAKPLVTWFHGHYPPTFITRGPLKGAGYGDKAMAYIIDRLPAFRHRTVFSTFNRALFQLREQDGGCVYGAFKTPERDLYMSYSPPMSPTLPNRVIVMKNRVERLAPYRTPAGLLDLDALTAAESLTVGLIKDRFYSPRINAAFEDRTAVGNTVVEQPEPRYHTLLARGRIDYAFGFPYEAAMQFREIGRGQAYTSIPIKGEPALMYGHIVCSDAPVGNAVVAALEKMAAEAGPYPRYMQFIEEWLTAEERASYRTAVMAAHQARTPERE